MDLIQFPLSFPSMAIIAWQYTSIKEVKSLDTTLDNQGSELTVSKEGSYFESSIE